MPSIYKRKRTRPDGRKVQDKHYTLSYIGADGTTKTAKGYRDKKATLEKQHRLQERADRQREGLPVAQEPGAADGRRLLDSVQSYLADLRRQGRAEEYLATVAQQLADVAAWCQWVRLDQVRHDGLTAFLGHVTAVGLARPEVPADRAKGCRRVKARPARPLSPRTANAFRDAAVSFVNWCVAQGWLGDNPLTRVPKAKVGAPGDLSKRPRARRALTVEEFSALIRCDKVPLARRQLYEVAGLSGLRGKELQQLVPFDFTLGDRPRFHCRPEITKGKRLDVVPMLPECAARLAELVRGKGPMEALFPRRPHHRTIERDLKHAKIPRRDERGRVANGHSLRYFFCTLVGGVLPIQRVRQLMRHQDIRTTCNLYLDLGIEDVADKLATLPALFSAATGAATGKKAAGNGQGPAA